ncbi:hypothetical protein GNP80_11115 [Aliivibrio fischeri]|uniref:hypothetical protein n=1 Tax=Aliivibrio fischeri TaxID=668 RepID=UPI0007C53615|nr:hypothetical protein [Aliivibrio fischeri]MCE7577339.1 hypothetical protein [Aliivibrio fischeri]MCE7589628.1 hypothetical protein [Aliivibrio fischeri]MUJ28109.1 hypothetical protein [Aliivibrio fischeri]MUK68392.1 hypothetical protein [Aliivibrio fischeri]MUK73744.1 hypothetical protein [Aliivibrio fischeri]
MDKVFFDSYGYKVTNKSFTYKGYNENIDNVLSLNIIEWSKAQRIKYGIGLGIFSVIMFYTIGWFLVLPILGALSEEAPYTYITESVTLVVFISFSIIGYFSRKRYTLELERNNGNKGTIGKSLNRNYFDELLSAFVQAKKLK